MKSEIRNPKPEHLAVGHQPKSEGRKTWNPWPVSIVAFFGVAILGCGAFIAFCSRHPADLVAADYYAQEIQYQGQVDRMQRAQAPAEKASVTYDPEGKQLVVSLPANHSHANASGQIELYRPSAANQDQRLKLKPDALGHQVIDARALLPGLWKVRVTWSVGQQDYFVDQSVVIPPRSS